MLGTTHNFLSEAAMKSTFNTYIGMEVAHSHKIGLTTTDVIKVKAVDYAKQLMCNDGVCFHKDWISSNPFAVGRTHNDIMKEFKTQLQNYMDIRRLPSNPNRNPTRIVSGKIGSNGQLIPGQHDDIATSLILNIYCHYAIQFGSMTYKIY